MKRVIFVEDRGMIKSEQMKDIGEFKWNFITAITKAQIKTLLKRGSQLRWMLCDKDRCS